MQETVARCSPSPRRNPATLQLRTIMDAAKTRVWVTSGSAMLTTDWLIRLESIAEAAVSFVSPVIDGPSPAGPRQHSRLRHTAISFARFILPDVRGSLLVSPFAPLSKQRTSHAEAAGFVIPVDEPTRRRNVGRKFEMRDLYAYAQLRDAAYLSG